MSHFVDLCVVSIVGGLGIYFLCSGVSGLIKTIRKMKDTDDND